MTVIVTDAGLAPDDWTTPMTPLDAADADATALDLHNGTGPDTLAGRLERVGMIHVDFAAVADGRGFTIAREVRLMGYTGRLRARPCDRRSIRDGAAGRL